jgi:hypothetical protein
VRSSPGAWLAGGLLAGAFLWVHLPFLAAMVQRWGNDARYSHGYLVPLFGLFLLYARRGQLAGQPAARPSWWGVPLLLAGLAMHAAGSYV